MLETLTFPLELPHPAGGPAGTSNWYAVHTRSKFEKRVAGELAAKQVTTYLPLSRELHQWKDRRKEVEIPVFPGYVFVRMEDVAESRLQVLRTIGAVRILGHGGGITAIPDDEIAGIRRLLESPLPCFAHPFVHEGDWVRVKRGPLKGVEGRMSRFKAPHRLVLSIDILSRAVATEVPARDVEVVRALSAQVI